MLTITHTLSLALKLRKLDYDIKIRVIKDEPAEKAAAIKYKFGYNDERTEHFTYDIKFIKNLDYCIYPQKVHERGRIINVSLKTISVKL